MQDVDNIIDVVCKAAEITASDLKGRSRNPRLVAARYIAVHFIHDTSIFTSREIAQAVNRDRTTVNYALTMHEANMRTWPLYRALFDAVNNMLISTRIALVTISHFCER